MKQTIGEIAISVMKREGYDMIDIGMYGLLDEIFGECKKRGVGKRDIAHPLDRQVYIMAHLRKSRLFRLRGYITYPGIKGAARCALLEVVPTTPPPV